VVLATGYRLLATDSCLLSCYRIFKERIGGRSR